MMGARKINSHFNSRQSQLYPLSVHYSPCLESREKSRVESVFTISSFCLRGWSGNESKPKWCFKIKRSSTSISRSKEQPTRSTEKAGFPFGARMDVCAHPAASPYALISSRHLSPDESQRSFGPGPPSKAKTPLLSQQHISVQHHWRRHPFTCL